jgi:dTDP-4-amino-4,6-dideoxygalactose transaminase
VTAPVVPLLDLRSQHLAVKDAVRTGFDAVLEHGRYVLGDEVARFESDFARFSGAPHGIGVANGTDALELALRAAGVGLGDEVVLPTNSFVATALAVVRAGATPRLVDCDPVAMLIDVAAVERAISARTKAVVPVHLYGQMADMDAVAALARRAGLVIVEDAAQAHGAARHGRPPGAASAAAAFSFYPGKNLGAYGDGGAVVTSDPQIAERVRALRNYGSSVKYHHPVCGFNSRLDTLQAVVLQAKLALLAEWNAARRAAARRYDEMLGDVADVVRPVTDAGNEHVWHLYVVRVPRRERVIDGLRDGGIETGIHYPVPIHLQGAFASLGHRPGDFPVAERAAREVLSLPMFPHITGSQQERVVEALRAAVA